MTKTIFDQLTTAMKRAGLYRGLKAPILLRGKAIVPEEWYDPQHTAYLEGLAAGLNLDMHYGYGPDQELYEFTAKGEQ